MLADSVLGKLYRFWLNSLVFSALRFVFRTVDRVWQHSAIRNFLVGESRLQRAYEACLFSRVIRAILAGIVWFFSHILHWLDRHNTGSVNQRLWRRVGRSSVILKYNFLFGAFLALMFLCPHEIWSNGYALIAGIFFLLFYLGVCAWENRKPLDPAVFGIPMLLFFCACVLSLHFSYDLSDSLRVLTFYISAFLLAYLIAASVRDRRSLMVILGWLYVAVFFTACYAVLQRFMGVEVSSSLTDLSINDGVPGRVYSTLDNPNNYAEYLVLMSPLAAAWAMNVRKKIGNFPLRLPLCILMVVPLVALVMTYSRSGWIALALAALVFLYFANKKLLPLLFLLAVIAIPFLPSSVSTRFLTLFNHSDSSNSHRIHLWTGVLLMLKDHGLTGIGLGPGSFAEVYPEYARVGAKTGAPHCHMVYMELIVETGLFGFLSFMWFFLRTIKNAAVKAVRSHVPARRLCLCAALAAICGIAFSFCVEYVWYYPRVLFAFFLVCGLATGLSVREDKPFQRVITAEQTK